MTIDIKDPTRLPKKMQVLFCWQDHLLKKYHRTLITKAIDLAIARVNDELPDDLGRVLVRVDATAERSGAVEIANEILEAIGESTVVVGDVTPVLADPDHGRFYPNPNVMIELGYAARCLGWNRIVCVMNASIYKAEQLPFDIRHRRATTYKCADESQRGKAASDLVLVFEKAFRAIIMSIGRGEIEPVIGDRALRRARDLRFLDQLMRTISRDQMGRYIDSASRGSLYWNNIYFWHGFDAMVRSCEFRFYDKRLEDSVVALHDVWGDAVHWGGLVYAPGSGGRFSLKPQNLWDPVYRGQLDQLHDAHNRLPAALKTFLDHVHASYPEIDMDDTDRAAWECNKEWIERPDGISPIAL
jgi:hypothetical protein